MAVMNQSDAFSLPFSSAYWALVYSRHYVYAEDMMTFPITYECLLFDFLAFFYGDRWPVPKRHRRHAPSLPNRDL
jgi:hypothetical protein